jgi:hypothetical protein
LWNTRAALNFRRRTLHNIPKRFLGKLCKYLIRQTEPRRISFALQMANTNFPSIFSRASRSCEVGRNECSLPCASSSSLECSLHDYLGLIFALRPPHCLLAVDRKTSEGGFSYAKIFYTIKVMTLLRAKRFYDRREKVSLRLCELIMPERRATAKLMKDFSSEQKTFSPFCSVVDVERTLTTATKI